MKKIYVLFSVLMASVSSFAQYTEDFETAAGGNSTAPPAGWSTTGTEWKFQNSGNAGPAYGVEGAVDHTTGSGIYAWIDASGGIAANTLTSPAISFTGSAPHVGFWLLSNNITDAAQNFISIEVNDGANWVSLGSYSGNNANWVKVAFPIPTAIPSPAQFRIIQTGVANGGNTYFNDLLIDDFFIEDYVCFPPSAMSIPSVSSSTGDISWGMASGANAYNVEWGFTGYTVGVGQEVGSMSSLTNSAQATGLSPETTYDVYVQTDCAAGVGEWVGPISFTTLPLCPMPDNVSLDAVAATNAAISWTIGTGNETLWDVEYGVENYVLGTGTMLNVLNGTADTTFNPLVQNTSYDYYVRANCPANNAVSFWVGPLSLTTLYSCPLPTNQSIAATEFGATLDWNPGGNEGSWNLNIVPQGNAQGDASVMMATITTPTHDTTFTAGLESNTAYSYYVQADCGSGDESVWAGPFDFTTTEYCFEPTGLDHANVTTTTVDLNWVTGAFGETAWNVKWGVDGFDPATEGTDVSGVGAPTTSLTGLTPGTDYSFYVEAICDLTAPNDTTSLWVGPYNFQTVIACPQPDILGLNAINISTTHANLVFQAGGTESSWDIEWGTAGFTVDNSEELGSEALTTTQYLATGLSTCGDYEFYVRANCGGVDGSSTWTGPYAFSTLTGTVMAPYTQNFDAPNLPNCWSNPGGDWRILESEDGAGTAGISGAATISGTGNYLFADSWDTRDQEVITPSIDFSGLANTAHVGFWALMNNTTDGVKNSVSVEAFDGDDWVLLGEYSANNADWVKVDYALPASFPVTTAQFRLVFNRIGGDNDDIFIDDFYVVDGETCVNEAGTAVAGVICTTENNIDLFDAIEGNSTNNGTWYYPNQANSLFSTTSGFVTGLTEGVDYTFEYVTTGCGTTDVVATTYTWSQAQDAGGDDSVSTCVSQDVDLADHLVGIVATGGEWIDTDNATGLVNGVLYTGAVAAGVYNFTYVLDNGTCTDSSMVTVTVDACLGLDANEESSLEVYPNPANTTVTIANLNVEGNAVITLVDLQGKVVLTKTINNVNGNYELDLSAFENGVYMIEITSETATQTVRVVKH